jgi:hypothetical protein
LLDWDLSCITLGCHVAKENSDAYLVDAIALLYYYPLTTSPCVSGVLAGILSSTIGLDVLITLYSEPALFKEAVVSPAFFLNKQNQQNGKHGILQSLPDDTILKKDISWICVHNDLI